MIPVQNQNIPFTLVGKHMSLGLHILRHVLVHIQMVGSQIGHYGNVAAVVHVHELEGAELHHRPVRGGHAPHLRQKGLAKFPPTQTVFPAARSISARRVVVVVFPSEPVTAITGQGQT